MIYIYIIIINNNNIIIIRVSRFSSSRTPGSVIVNAIPVQPTSTITSLQASYINLRRRIPVTAYKDLTMASKFEDDELGVHLSPAITSEKAALIDQVKSQLDADLLTGEREDVFPDTFHDFKFLRLLHGFGNDVNKVAETIKWIIEQRKKYGWNKVRKENGSNRRRERRRLDVDGQRHTVQF